MKRTWYICEHVNKGKSCNISCQLHEKIKVNKFRKKTITLTQYLLPEACGFMLPQGFIVLNDKYILETSKKEFIQNGEDLTTVINKLIETHNESFSNDWERIKIVGWKRLNYAQRYRTHLLDEHLEGDPRKTELKYRREKWKEVVEKNVTPSWVYPLLEIERLKLQVKLDTFNLFTLKSNQLFVTLKPNQKIKICENWSKIMTGSAGQLQWFNEDEDEINDREYQFDLTLAGKPRGEHNTWDWQCRSKLVEYTLIDGTEVNLIDTIKATKNGKIRREENDKEIGIAQPAYLIPGVFDSIDLEFTCPNLGANHLKFNSGILFLKIEIKDE